MRVNCCCLTFTIYLEILEKQGVNMSNMFSSNMLTHFCLKNYEINFYFSFFYLIILLYYIYFTTLYHFISLFHFIIIFYVCTLIHISVRFFFSLHHTSSLFL